MIRYCLAQPHSSTRQSKLESKLDNCTYCIRYEEDKKRATEQFELIGKLLDAQVASNNQRHAEEAAAQQQEIDTLKAKWAADDEAARQAERDARLRQQQLNAEVKDFNRLARAARLPAPLLYVQCYMMTVPTYAAAQSSGQAVQYDSHQGRYSISF